MKNDLENRLKLKDCYYTINEVICEQQLDRKFRVKLLGDYTARINDRLDFYTQHLSSHSENYEVARREAMQYINSVLDACVEPLRVATMPNKDGMTPQKFALGMKVYKSAKEKYGDLNHADMQFTRYAVLGLTPDMEKDIKEYYLPR